MSNHHGPSVELPDMSPYPSPQHNNPQQNNAQQNQQQLYPSQPNLFLDPYAYQNTSYQAPVPQRQQHPGQFSGLTLRSQDIPTPTEYDLVFEYAGFYTGPQADNEGMTFRPNNGQYPTLSTQKQQSSRDGGGPQSDGPSAPPQPDDDVGPDSSGNGDNDKNNKSTRDNNNNNNIPDNQQALNNNPNMYLNKDLENPHVIASMNIYSYIDKPEFISALLHFRTRQLWIHHDPKVTGFIDTQTVMAALPKICKHLPEETQQLILNKLKEILISGDTIMSINQFYSVLATNLGVYYQSNGQTYQTQFPPVQSSSSSSTIPLKPYQTPALMDSLDEYDPYINNATTPPGKTTTLSKKNPNDNRRKSIQDDKRDDLDHKLENVKKMRRNSQFANSLVGAADINTIAQYEDSKYRHMGSYQTCGQCFAAYVICPVAIRRFPFSANVVSKFGSSYLRLFQFISSLFWLNVMMAILSLLLLVKGQDGFPWASMASYPITRWVSGVSDTYLFSPKRTGFFFGQGLEQSFLFYSDWYSGPLRDWLGNLSLSMLWTILPMLSFFIATLFTIAHLSQSSTSVEDAEKLVLTVFSFDHRPRTARSYKLQGLHFKSSLYSLGSILREKNFIQQSHQFFGNQLNLRVRRIIGNVLNVVALVGCCVAIVFLTVNEQAISRDITDQVNNALIGQWAVPLFLSALKLVIPYIVKFCVYIESRDVIGHFRHCATRIFICKVFFIFVVLFQTQNAQVVVSDVDSTVTCRATITAVMLYKMLASDIVMDVGVELGVPCLFVIWNIFWYKCLNRPRIPQLGSHPTYKELDEHLYKSAIANSGDLYRVEFLSIDCLIDMLYTQILIWVGLPFSPVMAIMGVVYYAFQYVTRLIQVLALSRMPKVAISQNIQTNLLNIFLSVSLACAILSYTVFFSSNVTCGPHLFNPQETSGNSPAAGIIAQIYKLPSPITVIINLLGSPIILLCLIGVLFFVMMNYRLVLKQYKGDSKQLSIWLNNERSQTRMLRKQFSLRGVTTSGQPPSSNNQFNPANHTNAHLGGYATIGGGDMTPDMIVHQKQMERLKATQQQRSTFDFQRDGLLLAQIRPDEKDLEMLTHRARNLFLDFVNDLPDSISNSFQHYCLVILSIDDITPLLMMEREEILELLSQWNPVLVETSPLTVFFFDQLTRYRSKMLL